VVQRHHELLTLLFFSSLLVLIIQKNKNNKKTLKKNKNNKNSNNKKHKYFHNQTLILNQVIVFLFYFLKSNINQFNFIMSPFSSILKNTNKFLFATWLFTLKSFFSKLIKNTKQINQNFYPELRGSNPSRVRRQKT